MSRVLHINAPEDHITATCATKQVGVSAIERLRSGGTRVVLLNAIDTATIRKAYGTKVISGKVVRMPTRLMHQ